MPTTTESAASGNNDISEETSPLQKRLARILSGSDFPALSQQIIDTISLLENDASSLPRLANVVLREYSLTIAVVRTANSAHYRRTGRPIQSATHAMMMLGARTVRHLASSLLLFENYSKRSDSLKELMLLSLLTANHARELATRLGYADPEEAHLCGMFRNLGEVLVACHFPEDYVRIQSAVIERKITVPAATNALLGFRYEDLGEGLARHWGMPDSVMRSMRARPTAVMSDVGAITSFSHDLTATIYRRGRDRGDARVAIEELIERYTPRLKLSRGTVVDVVEASLTEAREVIANAHGASNGAAMRRLAALASQALGVAVLPTGEFEVVTVASAQAKASTIVRDKLRQELENRADSSANSTVAEILLLALEAALRGGPFDRVMACVLNGDRTRLVARCALGVGAEALMPQFDFAMDARGGPVVSALLLRQPFYFPANRAMHAQEMRWAASIGAAQLGVIPIIVATKIVGCLYVDRVSPHPAINADTQSYLQSLCDLVTSAIATRRAPRIEAVVPVPPATPAMQHEPSAWNASLQTALEGGHELKAEQKGALVLRLLKGEDVEAMAESTGIASSTLEQWRNEFLSGALSRLG